MPPCWSPAASATTYPATRSTARCRPRRHRSRAGAHSPRALRAGAAPEHDLARPLQPDRGGARPLGRVRHAGDDRRHARRVVRKGRGRRLQRVAALFSRRVRRFVDSSCRNCSVAVYSAAITRARRCAIISASRAFRPRPLPYGRRGVTGAVLAQLLSRRHEVLKPKSVRNPSHPSPDVTMTTARAAISGAGEPECGT